jgi:hypothetical protein
MNLPNGFHFRETPGHGYYSCAPEYNNNVPEFIRSREYEEDCAWSIPVVFNKGLFTPEQYETALQCFKRWFPADYERAFKRTLLKGESSMKDSHYFNLIENEGRYMKAGGHGDWCFDVPEDFVYAELRQITGPFNYGFDSGRGTKISVLMPSKTYQDKEFFTPEDFTPYKRNEEYYTWDAYTKQTGKERYK